MAGKEFCMACYQGIYNDYDMLTMIMIMIKIMRIRIVAEHGSKDDNTG